jgi:hypothetical protein
VAGWSASGGLSCLWMPGWRGSWRLSSADPSLVRLWSVDCGLWIVVCGLWAVPASSASLGPSFGLWWFDLVLVGAHVGLGAAFLDGLSWLVVGG